MTRRGFLGYIGGGSFLNFPVGLMGGLAASVLKNDKIRVARGNARYLDTKLKLAYNR